MPCHPVTRRTPPRIAAAKTWLAQQKHAVSHLLRGRIPEWRALAGLPLRGTCPVCGTVNVRFRRFDSNLRESGPCSTCHASNRQRQMAFALRQALHLSPRHPLALPPGCRLYNAEPSGPVHTALAALPGYICSGYWGDDHAPGAIVGGVRHEDLQHLSFADAAFDYILTSDVLEHVPDAYQAHCEIFRVLRPGGSHIFTVPFDPGASHDDVRATRGDAGITYIKPPLYHGDPLRPDQGVLVWRIFGAEMLRRLARIGFDTATHQIRVPDLGILGDNAIIFVSTKPHAASELIAREAECVAR